MGSRARRYPIRRPAMTIHYYAQRQTCKACQRDFTCASAYHMHIIGRRAQANSLRCRTDDEMRAIGMGQREDGAWKSRVDIGPKKLKIATPRPGRRRAFA